MNKNTTMKSRGGKCLALLVLLLTFTLGAKANPVDSRRAHLVASNFLNAYGARSAELTDISARAGFTNLYVFSSENGFVLLAADDRVQPILGYSFTDKFDLDNMPDNKRAWIQEYSDQIQAAIDRRSTATAEVAQLWRDLAEGNSTRQNRAVVVDALLATQWNQDAPYNNLCPMIGSNRTVTGCVATAMAQIMKYHGYPSRGIGSHSYTWNGQTLNADFQNTNYDWANMINSYAYGAGTNPQKQAVATLMYHCGVSVNMDYGTAGSGGSGAYNSAIAPALKNYFNYSKNTSIEFKSNYNDAAWIAMLKNNLDNSRPVLYTGSSEGGGHAFVCDGYRDDNYFHFNWGWGGYCDEWYMVNNLNPGPGGIGSGSNGIYNNNQSVVVNIYPSPNNAIPTNLAYTLNGRNVTLNWNTAAGVASYNIYRDGNLVGNATTNSFTHTNAPFGEGSYFVRSVNANEELSLSSNVVEVTVSYPTPVVNDLAATVSGRDVTLTWTAPDWCYPSTPTATMTYGGGTPDGAIGITGQSMYWGHRYLAANLNDYDDMHVYKVSFYAEETGDYRLHIYQGTNGTRPQTQVVQQDLTVFAPGWQEIDLNNTVQIDASQDLWVFMYDPLTRDYPASVCNSNYNVEGSYLSIHPYSPTGFVQSNDGINFNIRTYVSDGNYTYNLYRNGSSIANNLTATTYSDNNLADGTYNYTVKTNYYAGLTGASNTATVTIAPTTYTITATANPTAGGTVTGGGTYNQGASCTLTATPATGYTFVNWTKNGSQVSTNATYTFNVTEAGDYVANFQINTYTITATANPTAGGTVTGSGTFNHGQSCTLTATPATGYTFVNWTKNGSQVSTNATYTFNVTEAGDYVANFQINTYTITATANPTAGGTVSGGGTYNHGASCTLTATANTGYNFVNWTKNGTQVSTNASFSFNVTEDATYVANFEAITYTITATANPTAGGTVSGGGTYNHGASCTLTATANTGYNFVNWTKNGTQVSTNPNYTFTVTEPASYVANFEAITYTITATANPTAGGTVSGGGTYNQGASCTLTATANTGYDFVNWTKNGTQVSTNASFSFNVTENATYVAHFEVQAPTTYTITATANPTAGGTVSGGGTYNQGASCTLTATANSGYDFVNWTKNGAVVSTNASFSFNVTENATYVAHFEVQAPTTYTITATANPSEGGTVTGGGTYNQGASCTLTATANSGYDFVNWTKNGAVVSTNASFSFNVTENATYVAHFEVQAPTTYTITATANPTAGGTVSGGGTYNQGASCTLTATANSGYNFVNWTKNGTQVSTNASFSFNVTEDATYVANFEAITYTITATANPTAGGTVSGGGTYNHGASCTLTATANTGYNFVNWTKNGTQVSTNASFSFNVTENATYVANFEAITYTITATANPTAGGTVSGGGTYNHGASCTLTATANTGYNFVNWTKNGTQVSTNASFSFNVTENATYVAHFEVQAPTTYTITATANPSEGGTVTGGGTYNQGASCTLTATANTGYDFVNWTKNGAVVSTNASFSFNVTENATYVAHFEVQAPTTYTITATANPTAGGTVSGGGTYNHGASCTLTATANTGYNFVNWTKNGTQVSTNASFSFNVTENATYVAHFEVQAPTTYTITATANPTAGGTVSGGGTYNQGASCTLTATANSGYDFVNWTKNGAVVSTNASFSFNVTENATYVAHFEVQAPTTYTITATANPTAGGTVSGGGTYNQGASCTLTATANTGYNFVNWTKNGTQVSTNASFSFNVTENATYVANFEAITYTITATANPTAGGTVSGGGTYNHGASCTLTATANTGYNFVNWTKNGTQVSTNASFSFNVTENATYVAHFEVQAPTTYTITATANPTAGGTVSGGGTYNQGASCTLTATANMGYTFVNWTKGGIEVSTNASFSFTVTENAAYVANFEPIQWPSYTITATANPTEGGTVTGTGTYDHGQICTLIATANPGYTFVNWTENGAEVSTFATYSFPVSGNRNFVANFVASGPQVFEITAKTEPEGNAGLIEGIGFYNYGETCTLTVTPYGNYQFVNWTLNGVVVAETESFSFVVTEDQFYIANLQYITDVEELPSVTTEVYPNPAINKITVEISEPVETLEIYSSTGALVYRVAAGFDKTTIDVSGLAPGTYTLRVNTTQGVVSKKFVKNR